jgi:ATP-dependent DNA helicase RecQ
MKYRILKHIFGYNEFRPFQESIVDAIVDGKDVLTIMPTGGGKSLCYQLPAIIRPGVCIVICPLLALMKDQVDAARENGIKAAYLNSTTSLQERRVIFAKLYSNDLDLLYVSPERLALGLLEKFKEFQISFFAIDEAHCISEWGHDFRPDYLVLSDLKLKFSDVPVTAFTASATLKVQKDIIKRLNLKDPFLVNASFDRPNLFYSVERKHHDDAFLQIEEFIKKQDGECGIIYRGTRQKVDDTAEYLKKVGINALPYHAGMASEQRKENQEKFSNDDVNVIVATIAFGMGIDKSDIRRVFHYNLPKSIENYSQEIGRAGRDGKPAVCTMFADLADMTTLQNFTYGDTPEKNSIEELTEELLGQNTTFDISYYELSEKFDIRELVLKTYFTYLELLGILTHIAPYYSEYKVQFSLPEDKIYEAFDQTRSAFLKKVFMSGKKGRTWLTINIKDCSEQLNEDRVRIVRALNYLEENGFIILKVSGVRQVYRLNSAAATVDSGDLINKLQELFAKREERDIAMSSNIIRLLEHRGCKVRFILNFFGENFKRDCGHCEWCITRNDTTPVSSPKYHLTESDKLSIAHLQSQFPSLLGTNRKITRFLCGISSPRTSRTRIACITPEAGGRKQPLTRHKDFGKFSQVPFRELLSILESC